VNDLELVAEHDDLNVLLEPGETMSTKKLDGATDQTVEERKGHGPKGSPRYQGWSSRQRSGFVHPTSTGQDEKPSSGALRFTGKTVRSAQIALSVRFLSRRPHT
jgi:hypothetical protein